MSAHNFGDRVCVKVGATGEVVKTVRELLAAEGVAQ